MVDIAQIALQNDLFIAGGIGFFLNLPFVRPYWKPVIPSKPLPEQSQILPHSGTIVTQTVTVVPQPITLSPAQTVYHTVTQDVTSVSTIKQSCLPGDPTVPRATLIEYSEVCTLPKQTCAPCPPCAPLSSSKSVPPIVSTYPEAGCAPCAPIPSVGSVSPITSTSPGALGAWVLLPLAVVVLGATFLASRLDLISKSVATAEGRAKKARLDLEAEKKSHQKWKFKACDYSAELEASQHEVQDLLEGIARRNEMLNNLGVFADGDQIDDEEHLYRMMREWKWRIEAEKTAQSRRIKELVAERANAKKPQSEIPTPEVLRQYQLSLNEKQREIMTWRDIALSNNVDATVKEFYQRCEEKEAELQQLRVLPAEINELKQALSDASNRIERLQQEKKDQGIADRRRWNKEKEDLCEKHAKAIKDLKVDLKKVQQSSTRLKSALPKMVAKTRPGHSEDNAATKQLHTIVTETMDLQLQHSMKERFSTIFQALEEIKKERDELKMIFVDAESKHATENKQLLEEFDAQRSALIMENMNLEQEVENMKQRVSDVVRESEEIKEKRDELRRKCVDLQEEWDDREMDLEVEEDNNAVENTQRYADLKAEQKAIGVENITVMQEVYDIKEMMSKLSQNFLKFREEREELWADLRW